MCARVADHPRSASVGHPHPWPLSLPGSARTAADPIGRATVASLLRSTERAPQTAGPLRPSQPRFGFEPTEPQGGQTAQRSPRQKAGGQKVGDWAAMNRWKLAKGAVQTHEVVRSLFGAVGAEGGREPGGALDELEARCAACLAAALEPELLLSLIHI